MPIYVGLSVSANEVASITITRDGDTHDNHADYTVLLLPSKTRRLGHNPVPVKEARVRNFDRSRGAVELLYEAMSALHNAEPRNKTWDEANPKEEHL